MRVSWHASRRMWQRKISTARVQAAVALGKRLPDIQRREGIVRYEHKGLRVIFDQVLKQVVTLYEV